MRTQWTIKRNQDTGFYSSCDGGLHRYLWNFGAGFENPKPPLVNATDSHQYVQGDYSITTRLQRNKRCVVLLPLFHNYKLL